MKYYLSNRFAFGNSPLYLVCIFEFHDISVAKIHRTALEDDARNVETLQSHTGTIRDPLSREICSIDVIAAV